jgi:phospholipid/cholesterol/gamma-HCH transport system permease protein
MTESAMHNPDSQPGLMELKLNGHTLIRLRGTWTLRTLAAAPELRRRLKNLNVGNVQWDLQALDSLDSAAAFLLWQAWGERLPDNINMRPEHQRLFAHWHQRHIPTPPVMAFDILQIVQV